MVGKPFHQLPGKSLYPALEGEVRNQPWLGFSTLLATGVLWLLPLISDHTSTHSCIYSTTVYWAPIWIRQVLETLRHYSTGDATANKSYKNLSHVQLKS